MAAPPLRWLPESWEQLLAEEPGALFPEKRLLVRGALLSRKVLSRGLAFAKLKLEAQAAVGGSWQREAALPASAAAALEAEGVLGLCFAAPLLDGLGASAEEEGEAAGPGDWAPCPERRGDLHVGLRLEASVLLLPAYRPEALVRRWRRLPDEDVEDAAAPPPLPSGARDMAKHHAARDAVNRRAKAELRALGRGPALCKFWGLAGGCGDAACGFRHGFADEEEERRMGKLREAGEEARALAQRERQLYDEVNGGHHAEDKASKAQRAGRFAAWLLRTYGPEALGSGSGVLDIAGGQGDLSWALSVEHGVPCTLVDPGLRRGGQLRSWQRRALRKLGREQAFQHVAEPFDAENFARPANAALLGGASLVVGLHPDEATESIVDLSLEAGRRFAVVPCCVFAHLAPHRRLASGEPVRTANEFVAYLRAKDPRIQEALLDFEGRNKVLYLP